MHIETLLEFDVIPLDTADEVTVLLDVTAPDRQAVSGRTPATLQIVLDRSGSMQGAPIEGAIRALLDLVDRLDPADTFGLVIFDYEAQVQVPAGPLADKPAVRELIKAVFARGGTDLSSGLLRGIQEARRASAERGATLILISDGHANQGITEHSLLAECARGAYGHGITTTTLGYGLGYDEVLLGAIADGGTGNALFAEDPDTAGRLLAEQVENLLSKVAQATSLTIVPRAPVQSAGLVGDLPVNLLPDGSAMVELGDFYAGETRRMLLRFSVPGVSALGPTTVAELVVTSVDPATLTTYTINVPISVNVVAADEAAGRVAQPTVRTELAFQQAQEAKRRASEELRRGDRQAASQRILEAREELARRLAEAPPEMEREIRQQIAELWGLSQSALNKPIRSAAKEAYADWHGSSRKRRIIQEREERRKEANEDEEK